MEIVELLGYFGAIVIGFTLGLLGGGGSILTVPVLYYIVHLDATQSTAYSLFIVGISSLIGSFKYMQKKQLSYKTAVVFAVPSFIAVFLTRKFVMPAIPDELFTVGDFVMTKDIGVMVFFALIMVLAAFSMIRGKREDKGGSEEDIVFNYPMIMLEGGVVGMLTGIVGAGGGFLIIPALVILARLPMKLAVGTSLLIISAKSLIGFVGDAMTIQIDWMFLLIFSLFSIGGIFLGTFASRFIEGGKLKVAFGYFVLVMGSFILLKELVL